MSLSPVALGKIKVITGLGPGKTTFGLGVAMRLVGSGKKVMFLGFDCKAFSESEISFFNSLRAVSDNWNYFISEMCIESGNLNDVLPQHRRQAESLLSMAEKIMSAGKYDVLILDEINPVASLGIIPRERMQSFLNNKPVYLDLILTGKNCPRDICEKSDSILQIEQTK